MEQHKFRYLKLLLDRNQEPTVDKYVASIKSFEEESRSCYAEFPDKFKHSSDDFVQMLLLDGCFIIEFIWKYFFPEMRERNDPVFQSEQVFGLVRADMMLVENQVPFFILDKLFTMTRSTITTDSEPDADFQVLVQSIGQISSFMYIGILNGNSPALIDSKTNNSLENVDHIPGFAHKVWCSSFIKSKSATARIDSTTNISKENVNHILCFVHNVWCSYFMKMTPETNKDKEKFHFINSATELEESGIRFENNKENHWLDIKFEKGVIKIPGFTVADRTEPILRNLIALEQHSPDDHPTYVTNYTFVMQCLINSSKDVKVLRHNRIISNLLGDDEMVYRIFCGLGNNILFSVDGCYKGELNKIKMHCDPWGNRWMAILTRTYLNNPWAYLTAGASLLLLLLTLIQAVYSILQYKKFS